MQEPSQRRARELDARAELWREFAELTALWQGLSPRPGAPYSVSRSTTSTHYLRSEPMEKIRAFQESVEPVITAALREAILAQSERRSRSCTRTSAACSTA